MNAVATLKSWLTKPEAIETLKGALPSHITPDRIVRTVLTTVAKDRKLQACKPASIYECVVTTAQLGLEPGPLGLAYFVPYKDACTLIIGYRGMVELAMRSGALSTIYAEPVYESDEWEYRRGTDPRLHHVPDVFATDRGKLRGVYAFAKFKDGADASTVMSKHEVDGIKNRSRASSSGPWVTDYVEMAKKTVLRRLCKTLPLSPEFRETMQRDITTEYGTEDEPEPVKRKSAFAVHDAVHDAEVVDSDGRPDDALPDEPAGNPEDAVE